MARASVMAFAALAYAIFLATFLYLIAFVGDFARAPVTVDHGPGANLLAAIVGNLSLIALFGIQHSVMARRGFKRVWTRTVPPAAERSVYVLAASSVLILLFYGWRPVGEIVWDFRGTAFEPVAWVLFSAGWAVVLVSTFLINHFELFGLQQAWFNLRGRVAATPTFRQPFLYRFVRHPLYSGFFLAFWSTPRMTFGHLLLAAGMSAYMLIAIRYEERDLVTTFGDDYDDYRGRVGMLTPRLRRRAQPMP